MLVLVRVHVRVEVDCQGNALLGVREARRCSRRGPARMERDTGQGRARWCPGLVLPRASEQACSAEVIDDTITSAARALPLPAFWVHRRSTHRLHLPRRSRPLLVSSIKHRGVYGVYRRPFRTVCEQGGIHGPRGTHDDREWERSYHSKAGKNARKQGFSNDAVPDSYPLAAITAS